MKRALSVLNYWQMLYADKAMAKNSDSREAIRQLKRAFRQNGYVRMPLQDKRELLGQKYKKGYEVRLVAMSKAELKNFQQWIRIAGLTPGKPFEKTNRIIQPVYGAVAVKWFQSRTLKPIS
jgi:hypothetical protein